MLSTRVSSLAILGLTTFSKQRVASFVVHHPAPMRAVANRAFFSFLKGAEDKPIEFSSKQTVHEALEAKSAVVLDVRSVDEIVESGHLKTNRQWVHAPCTLQGSPLLSAAAESLIPNKKAPVIVYCASGKRAEKAKEILENMGYENVLNAGGFAGLG